MKFTVATLRPKIVI